MFIPLWVLPSSFLALSVGAFFVQFGVQGAWGVVRICVLRCERGLCILQNIFADPNPTCRDVTTSLQGNIPGCRLPAWKRRSSGYHAKVVANVFPVDGIISIGTN